MKLSKLLIHTTLGADPERGDVIDLPSSSAGPDRQFKFVQQIWDHNRVYHSTKETQAWAAVVLYALLVYQITHLGWDMREAEEDFRKAAAGALAFGMVFLSGGALAPATAHFNCGIPRSNSKLTQARIIGGTYSDMTTIHVYGRLCNSFEETIVSSAILHRFGPF